MLYHTPFISLVERAHAALLELDRPDRILADTNASFERMVRPSLGLSMEMGNVYSGSLYAALASLLDTAAPVARGTRVGMFSYGSGACSEMFSGLVAADATTVVRKHRIREHICARRPVTTAEYDASALEVERGMTWAEFRPDRNVIPGHFDEAYLGLDRLVLTDVANHYRSYAWS